MYKIRKKVYVLSLYFDIYVEVNIKETLNITAVVKICRNIAKKPAYFPYILTYIEGLKC